MKKRLLIGLTAIMLALVLTACSKSGNGDISVDISKLCQDLQGTIASGDLSEVSTDILASTYFFDMEKIEESTAALNSGASACEVVIVKCKDPSYVSEAKKLLETRVKNQSALFADYNVSEVSKLDAALIKTAGNYAVLCVTDDTSAAEDILKNAGF